MHKLTPLKGWRSFTYHEERDGLVYLWPQDHRRCRPLVLRLIRLPHGTQDVYLLTDVLDPESLSDAEAGELFGMRWGEENGLHYIKDRWWDEVRQWSTRPGLAERMAMLRDAALTALRLLPDVAADLPIRARADHLGRKLQKALRFIGAWD